MSQAAASPPDRIPHPWERSYPANTHWDAPIATGTLSALLDDAVAQWGDRPALEYGGRQISYVRLGELVDRMAAGLLAAGIGPGQSVALYLPNTPWHPVCFFALMRIGARVAHLSPLDARRELAHKMADSGARTLITTDFPPLLQAAASLLEAGAAERLLVGEDAFWGPSPFGAGVPDDPRAGGLSGLMDAPAPAAWPQTAAGDPAVLQYTGGTTGLPKGAVLTHANLTAAVSIYRAWIDTDAQERGTQRVLGVLPLFHIYALTTVLLRPLADGHEILLRPRFDAAQTLRDIEERRVTQFSGVPTMWIALLHHPDAAGRDFSSLLGCFSGGAPLPFEVQGKVERLMGRPLGGGWGMTETSPAGTRIPSDATPRPGLIGVPLPGIEMRVVAVEDPGRVLGDNEIGEIAVRGPNVFAEYWNKPAETAAAFRDGFFLTGDLGTMDADGLFTIVGRRKNMIISGGFNVYPTVVEGAIYEHPDVEEAIVIGVPDPYRGQSAKAFVKLKPDAAPLTLEALREFLADRLGKHEMPAALELRDALPRSPAGKLLASALEAEERERAGAAA